MIQKRGVQWKRVRNHSINSKRKGLASYLLIFQLWRYQAHTCFIHANQIYLPARCWNPKRRICLVWDMLVTIWVLVVLWNPILILGQILRKRDGNATSPIIHIYRRVFGSSQMPTLYFHYFSFFSPLSLPSSLNSLSISSARSQRDTWLITCVIQIGANFSYLFPLVQQPPFFLSSFHPHNHVSYGRITMSCPCLPVKTFFSYL